MIATNGAVDVLRHGWQDAASTFAADVPEVGELLQARLEMAISTERLDERHLLDTIQEVESVTFRAGSPSSQILARRLRRTVYEYLLALDAARPSETARASVDQPATAPGSPMVGAEEVAALGHASTARAGEPEDVQPSTGEASDATAPVVEPPSEAVAPPAASLEEEVETADDEQQPGPQSSRRRFALRRRQRQGTNPTTSDAADGEVILLQGGGAPEALDAGTADAQPAAPDWQYTPAGEPAVFQSDMGPPAPTVAADDASELNADPEATFGRSAETVDAVDAEPQPVDAEATTGEPEPAELAEPAPDEGIATATPGFVAPRAGFHIVEDAPPHRVAAPDEARLEMPAFTADEPAPSQALPPVADTAGPDEGSQFLAWRPASAPEVTAPETAPLGAAIPGTAPTAVPVAGGDVPAPASPAPAPAGPQPAPLVDGAAAQTAAVQPPDTDDNAEPRGWGVRRPGEAHSNRRGGHAVSAPPIEDDPFENNSRLADIRRRIEERLRKKRCDEAAALLQELAQEAGGRAVAELAMNAGDRCRALGKSNAALNCYLAAARSDPVYEMPLSRLADICIDNQDTELAVSYLERIARLYRYRGDDKAAIRMYRRIATVAPYRDDVLGLLMNAQRTGRLE